VAAKSGGAWKVAYADFVTAMMAFFLVMWICGQDQQIKRSVSYYFQDPFAAADGASSKKPSHTGSFTEFLNGGAVPQSETIAVGRGRNSYTTKDDKSVATKLVSDWVFSDKNAIQYWREEALRQRELAQVSKDGRQNEAAVWQLSKQLKYEITRGIPSQANHPYKELLQEIISSVNWTQIAEDLLAHN
jgi:flagellar motor protein MotB